MYIEQLTLPTAVEPVKEIFRTVGCVHRVFTKSEVHSLLVVTTLNTPSGIPAWCDSCRRRRSTKLQGGINSDVLVVTQSVHKVQRCRIKILGLHKHGNWHSQPAILCQYYRGTYVFCSGLWWEACIPMLVIISHCRIRTYLCSTDKVSS